MPARIEYAAFRNGFLTGSPTPHLFRPVLAGRTPFEVTPMTSDQSPDTKRIQHPDHNPRHEKKKNRIAEEEAHGVLGDLLRDEFFPRQSRELRVRKSFRLDGAIYSALQEVYWQDYCKGELRSFSELILRITADPLPDELLHYDFQAAFKERHHKHGAVNVSVLLSADQMSIIKEDMLAYFELNHRVISYSAVLEARVLLWLLLAIEDKILPSKAKEILEASIPKRKTPERPTIENRDP